MLSRFFFKRRVYRHITSSFWLELVISLAFFSLIAATNNRTTAVIRYFKKKVRSQSRVSHVSFVRRRNLIIHINIHRCLEFKRNENICKCQ